MRLLQGVGVGGGCAPSNAVWGSFSIFRLVETLNLLYEDVLYTDFSINFSKQGDD